MNWIQKNIAEWVGLDKYVNPLYFERYSTRFVDGHTDFGDFSDDIEKLRIIFSNPAVLKVFQIRCNMFSMGKLYAYKNEKVQESDPLIDRIRNANFFQQKNQWLWDYMFWKMVGNAYCYIDSKIVTNDKNQMYWLDSSKMSMPVEMQAMRDKIILSAQSYKKVQEQQITYRYANGDTNKFRWENIMHIPDLTNGSGNWFKSSSRLTTLYKIVANSEAALDSKNINVRYSGKFIVSGKTNPDDTTKTPMLNSEKTDIEEKTDSRIKNVYAMKSAADIKRFVESAAIVGELDKSYLNDYFLIGAEYDIPKDVLEAFNSGTYENQEKARGAFVSYCLQPDAEALTSSLENFFGYTDISIQIDWEHLPFMQVFAKERAETGFKVTQSLINLMKAGVKIDEINAILDLNLTQLDYEGVKASGIVGENQGNQGENT